MGLWDAGRTGNWDPRKWTPGMRIRQETEVLGNGTLGCGQGRKLGSYGIGPWDADRAGDCGS